MSLPCLPAVLAPKYVVQEEVFPKVRVLKPKIFADPEAQPEVDDDDLVLLGPKGVRPHQHVPWVGVKVDEPSNKDLLRKCPDQVVDEVLLVKAVLLKLILLRDLEAIDPLGHHHPLPGELVYNLRDVVLVTLCLAQ